MTENNNTTATTTSFNYVWIVTVNVCAWEFMTVNSTRLDDGDNFAMQTFIGSNHFSIIITTLALKIS